MKKIITLLMVAVLLTAFAMPQDKPAEPAPAELTKYATEKADLVAGYNQLADQKVDIEKRLDSILWAIQYLEALEKAELDKAKDEPEESK